MAEKIVNGAFPSNLSSWTNVGAYSFIWAAGSAFASSDPTSGSYWVHKLDQSFAVPGLCVSALVSAYITWDVPEPPPNRGSVVFYLRLIKPDATLVELASAVYNGASSGAGWLANALNIAAHITQVGTYTLRLEAQCSSGWHLEGDEPVYVQSMASYDNISVTITEQFFKTVLEGIGGGDALGSGGGGGEFQGALEKIGGHETLTANGGEDLVGGLFTDTQSEVYGLHEFLSAKIPAVVSDLGIGMKEFGPIRTYGGRNTPGNTMGLDESLVARWQQGNVGIRRDIILGDDAWTDLAKVATTWEMI